MNRPVAFPVSIMRPATWAGSLTRAAGKLYPRGAASGRGLAGRSLRQLRSLSFGGVRSIQPMSAAGLVLLAASLLLWLSTIRPLSQGADSLEQEVARLEQAVRAGEGAPASDASRAERLLQQFPTRDELPGILAAVIGQAESAGLELQSGEYDFTPARSGAIARYRLSFPVQGSYPQLRRFIEGTLAAVPALALEGLRLERASVADEVVEADLRFSVVVRSGA